MRFKSDTLMLLHPILLWFIVALLALNQGVIGQAGYVSLVTMSLVTTLIVPLVLRNWLYRENKSPG